MDRAGKTTQVKLLQVGSGNRVVFYAGNREEQSGRCYQESPPQPEYTGLTSVAEALLYVASRAQLVAEVIRPALAQGRLVVCDRFVDSSIAYQAYGRGLPRDFVEEINRLATGGLLPRLTILLDLEPALREERLNRKGRPARDRLEAENGAFYTRVREGYLALARENRDRIKLIPARHSIEEVHRQVLEHITGIL